jgi:pentachlorophenol monooxygenase/3-(3-hydroxy-phenyl)propionate hydroxylase
MTSWPHEPVLVVGAGPVGQTTALLLARWGVPSVVLDKRPARDLVGSKAICQQRDVLDIWASVGAGEQIAAEGVTWTTARTFHRADELFAHTFADAGSSPFPPFVNLSQSRTEEILDERIAEEPLVDLRWGQEVTDLAAHSAPFTVLCTGAAGALRRTLGVTFDGFSFDDRFLICDIRTDLPGWATERRFFFDPEWNPGRQVLVHPCPDGTFRIDWQVPADYDLDAEVASGALDQRIRAIIGDRPYEIVWKSVYRFHSRIASRMRVGRVLLAGDAAHLVSPFGARGLNSGVADAENAAWKIAHVGYGWAPEELLESYHAERHAAARENLAVTTATMDFLVPPDAERAAHRADVLARAAVDPAARAHVNSGRLAEPFWYHESPLTTPDPTRPFGGRPPRGAVPPAGPGVLVPDVPLHGESSFSTRRIVVSGTAGRPARLRELARDGFLVLLTEGADPAVADAAARAVAAPVRVAPLDPAVAAALGARPGEAWVLRPDAHVAAIVQTADLETALCRALGHPTAIPRHPTEGARPCRTTTAAVTSPRSATPSTADPTGASTPRS